MNYKELIIKITQAQEQLRLLEVKQRSLPGYYFIKSVYERMEFDMFASPTELLIEEILDRDEPMTFDDIKRVFEVSGFDYTDDDIRKTNPNSDEQVQDQLRWYRE